MIIVPVLLALALAATIALHVTAWHAGRKPLESS